MRTVTEARALFDAGFTEERLIELGCTRQMTANRQRNYRAAAIAPAPNSSVAIAVEHIDATAVLF